jgi:hypothetical protein
MSVNRTYDSQFRFGRLELKQSGVKGSIPQIRMFLR